MLCLSGFELYSRWVPLLNFSFFPMSKLNWNQLGGSNESDSVNQKYDSDFRRLLRKNCFLNLTAMPLFITKS